LGEEESGGGGEDLSLRQFERKGKEKKKRRKRKRKRKQEERAAYLLNTPASVRLTSADETHRRSGCVRQATAITDLVVGTLTGVLAILGATSGTVFINTPSRLANNPIITEGTGSLRQLLDTFSVGGGGVDWEADVTSASTESRDRHCCQSRIGH